MFVFSFKASKFRVLFAVVLCALIAFTAIVLLPETEHSVTVNGVQFDRKIRFDGIKSTDDLAAFAENLGYAVDASPVESVNVKLPSVIAVAEILLKKGIAEIIKSVARKDAVIFLTISLFSFKI